MWLSKLEKLITYRSLKKLCFLKLDGVKSLRGEKIEGGGEGDWPFFSQDQHKYPTKKVLKTIISQVAEIKKRR